MSNGNSGLLERMVLIKIDVIDLNWTVDMADGCKELGDFITQGTIVEPAVLFTPLCWQSQKPSKGEFFLLLFLRFRKHECLFFFYYTVVVTQNGRSRSYPQFRACCSCCCWASFQRRVLHTVLTLLEASPPLNARNFSEA